MCRKNVKCTLKEVTRLAWLRASLAALWKGEER